MSPETRVHRRAPRGKERAGRHRPRVGPIAPKTRGLKTGRPAEGDALKPVCLVFEEEPEPEVRAVPETTEPVAFPLPTYDELTGLPNRRLYSRRLAEEVERARRQGGALSLLWLDVHGLRRVNQEHGSLQGDHVLARIGALLHEAVDGSALLFRFAGPEFVVLFPGAAQEEACGLADHLLQAVSRAEVRLLESSQTVRLSMSVGVAVFPDGVLAPEDLEQAAFRAGLRAGREGPQRLAVHGPEDPPELATLFPCPLMVGRDQTIRQVVDVLRSSANPGARPPTPPVALVRARLGLGSTRLLQAVAERCRQEGFRILQSRARAATVGQPFVTLLRALEDLLHREPGLRPVLRAALREIELAALGPLTAAFRSGPPTTFAGKVPLRPALVRMLVTLCQQGPLLVVLDDAHLLERTSLQVLQQLWAHNQAGLSICAAVDPEDPEASFEAEGHPLRDFVHDLRSVRGLHEVLLEPLEPVHVRSMLEAILPVPPRDVLVAEVYRRSRGNPLLAQETLRDIVHGRKAAQPGQRPPVLPRLEALDAESSRLLAHAAVLGESFTLAALAAIEGRDEGGQAGLLERARRLELLECLDQAESFRFPSEFTRRDLIQGLPEEELRHLHAEIARVLQAPGGELPDGSLSEVAYHLRRAGDSARAREVELRLADLHRRCALGEESPEAPGASAPQQDLTPTDWAGAMETARLLRLLVKGVRFYGVDHPQVVATQADLLQVLQQFHLRLPRLDFSEARGTLIVNGHPPDAAARRIGRLDLGPSWNLQSLSFVPGLTHSELQALTDALALGPDELKAQGGMAALLAERGVTHVIPNDRQFVEVGERDVLLRRTSDEGLVLVREQDGDHVDTPAPGDGGSAEVPLTELASLMAAREEVAAWYEETSKYLDLSFVEELSADWDVLVADLESGNRIKMAAAAKAFLERGEDSIHPLTQLLARSPDARARKIALHLLQKLDREVVPHLLSAVHGTWSEEERPRLLACLEDFEAPAVAETLVAFMSHPSRQVRATAIRALERRDPKALLTELTRLLSQRGAPVEVQLDCLEAVGRNRFRELLPRVLQFCRSGAPLFVDLDPRLQVQACKVLGQLQERDGLQALLRCLSRRFSLYRARSPEARCAAALAMADFVILGSDTPRVHRALNRAARDQDAAVRAAARLAISRMQFRNAELPPDLVETHPLQSMETLLEGATPAPEAAPRVQQEPGPAEALVWESLQGEVPAWTGSGENLDLPDLQELLSWQGSTSSPQVPAAPEGVAWMDGDWPGLVPPPEEPGAFAETEEPR